MSEYDRRQLEQFISLFDKILCFPYTYNSDFLKQGLRIFKASDKKILILASFFYMLECSNLFIEEIPKEKAEKLISLYKMYEFTDNFSMITDDNTSFPNIFNYVETGLLTLQEAWQALLS